MNQLDLLSRNLIFEGRRLEPVSLECNMVGFCSKCDLDLESLAYHCTQSNWLVCARCKNEHIILMRYDRQWNWQGDSALEIITEKVSVSSIAKEKLDAVFTQAEVRDMLACQQGLPYTRQNLYRARAKYEKFEKLFGIKIDV
jgi:NMD protein affecting ribosome stability and mRNA decay